MGKTTVELVKDLETKLTVDALFINQQQREEIFRIITEAKAGEFHDFLNDKYPLPKMELHRQLLNANLGDLAKKVVEGEYDNEAPEDTVQS